MEEEKWWNGERDMCGKMGKKERKEVRKGKKKLMGCKGREGLNKLVMKGGEERKKMRGEFNEGCVVNEVKRKGKDK